MQLINSNANSKLEYLVPNSTVVDFFHLMKPRVMSLVVFTAFVGMVLSPEKIHPLLVFLSLVSIAAGAGASGAFNQWIDREIDAIMLRTKGRPIPSGKVDPSEALTLAGVVSIFSVILLGLASNWMAAFLLAFTIFFYVIVYSLFLKHKTSLNIVIGGAAGSFPPVIGWLSMGSEINIIPIFLFSIIFFWTPPHFWALAILKKEDYQKAKVPMLPVVSSEKHTRVQIVIYSFLVFVVSVLPGVLGYFGLLYLVGSIFCNLVFFLSCVYLLFKPSENQTKKLFFTSILYLFFIFNFILFDYFIKIEIL